MKVSTILRASRGASARAASACSPAGGGGANPLLPSSILRFLERSTAKGPAKVSMDCAPDGGEEVGRGGISGC